MNWPLLQNSLLVGGATALLATGLGFAAALAAAGLERRARKVCLALALMALALPPFLVTNTWLDVLSPAREWSRWLPLNLFSPAGVIWILSLMLWPIPMLAALSAWRRLEPAHLESDLLVTGWALIRVLLLPLARAALLQAALLTFVLALNNFAVPAILQVKVFPAEMWVRFNTTFDTPGVLVLSWPLVIGPLLLLAWFRRREPPWPHLQPPVSARRFRQQLGPAWFAGAGLIGLLLLLLSTVLPLWEIVSAPRTWNELPGALAAGHAAAWNSFFFAALAATLVAALGVLAAVRRVGPTRSAGFQPAVSPTSSRPVLGAARGAFGLALWLPLLLPGVLLGLALIYLFNHSWSAFLYQGAGIVVLAFVVRYFALGCHSAAHAVQTSDPLLADAARLEGASRWQLLRHVYWPQISPQVAAVWYIVFLLCLWDVESMILVVPPGGETLALRIFNLLHYGHNAQVNALCLTLLALALAPLLVWQVHSRFTFYVSRITHHASRFTFLIACLTLLAVLPGCSPSPDSLSSRFFERVQIIGLRGVGVGELNKPRSVAVDRQDNLYVVDMTGRVQKFDSNGVFALSWQMPQTDKGRPKGLCRDHDGNIVVCEPHYSRINHFTTAGKLVAQWGEHGTNAGQLAFPRAVAVNSRNEMFVSEYGLTERVQKFRLHTPPADQPPLVLSAPPFSGRAQSPTPTDFLLAFGQMGNAPGRFNRPEGLCVDAQDRVYVADSCNHRIQVFSSDGQLLRAYGKAGSGPGDLSYPYDVCVDAAGCQYVCEFGNSRIQVFDPEGKSLEIIGGPGAAPGRFSNPWGVALDSAGNLYVADSQNHRVQKLVRRATPGRS